jgi:DNA-binding CsgD family transcriptional regulator
MWPFEGRQAELERIHSAFSAAEIDAMMITAAAGIGKTRLVRQALSTLDSRHIFWVGATRAGTSIPFAAVAPLIPDGAMTSDNLGVIRAAARHMRDRGGRRHVAIAVDDANLLDDASATLVAHLVTHGLAFVLMMVRAGEPVPDALLRLVKDCQAARVELPRLPGEVIDRLIDHATAQPLGARARRRLHQVAQGNPLALRELLHSAEPGGLTDLITSRLDGLETGTRQVVELVACGEPVGVAILEEVAGLAAVTRAEDTGLIAVERDGERRQARLDHPLYGEVLRSRMTVSRAVRTYRALADALLATPLRRRADILRAARWQLEAGVISRPEVVLAGAWLAVGHEDLWLAERLARAARAAGPSAEADRLLAEILSYRGQTGEAARILPAEPPTAPEDRVAWAVTRAETQYWGDGDIDGALSTLEGGQALARASMSWLLFFDARCAEAAIIGAGVLDDPGAEPRARIWAAAAACAANGFLSRIEHAARLHRRGAAIAAQHCDTVPWGVFEVETGFFLAQLSAGYPEEAEKIAEAGYDTATHRGAAMMLAGWALYRGLAAVARGHLDAAERLLAEAHEGFTANDTFRLNRCCQAARAAVAALRGDPEAGEFLRDADRLAHPSNNVFAPWIETWRAWTMYAQGDLAEALAASGRAGELARRASMPAVEALARYDIARLGGKAELSRLDGIGGDLAAELAGAARALDNRRNPGELEAAAQRFQARGYDLHAAEAYVVASDHQRKLGRRAHAELAGAKAAALPAAPTPLRQPDRAGLLSPRERQVALLAAHHTSAEIAARLGLSVPTVNNNLARAYTKLGISGRSQLRSLLAGSSQHPESG